IEFDRRLLRWQFVQNFLRHVGEGCHPDWLSECFRAGQTFQKASAFEPRCVDRPKRWKLEDRAKYHREAKSVPSRVAPFLQSTFEREPIERVVQLNCIEMPRVEL